jgi:hypothetical protein
MGVYSELICPEGKTVIVSQIVLLRLLGWR